MNLIRINTTAFEEEDFFLITDLDEQDILDVLSPVVFQERLSDKNYTNDDLFFVLKKCYPSRHIQMFHEINRMRV